MLNPGGTITYAHLDRAVDLAVRYELNLALVSDWRRAAACSATRTIETPPIYDDAELALFDARTRPSREPSKQSGSRVAGRRYSMRESHCVPMTTRDIC